MRSLDLCEEYASTRARSELLKSKHLSHNFISCMPFCFLFISASSVHYFYPEINRDENASDHDVSLNTQWMFNQMTIKTHSSIVVSIHQPNAVVRLDYSFVAMPVVAVFNNGKYWQIA